MSDNIQINDIRIPFGSMFVLAFKWAIATTLVMIIPMALLFFVMAMMGALAGVAQ